MEREVLKTVEEIEGRTDKKDVIKKKQEAKMGRKVKKMK